MWLKKIWFLTRAEGGVSQFLIFSDKGGRGVAQFLVFGWHGGRGGSWPLYFWLTSYVNSPLDTMDMVAAGGDGVEEVDSGGGGGDGGTLIVTEGLN